MAERAPQTPSAARVRIGYAVFSHRDPEQVERLVERLVVDDDDALVLIRHDPSPLGARRPFVSIGSPASAPDVARSWLSRVEVVPVSRPTAWGSFAFAESMLEAMRWAWGRGQRDWLVLLSGQDYPARPLSQLKVLLATAGADAFLEVAAVGDGRGLRRRRDEGAEQYRYRYWTGPDISHRPFSMLYRLQRAGLWQPFVSVRANPRDNRMLFGYRSLRAPFTARFPPAKGRNWFAVNRRAIGKILAFVDDHPRYVKHYRRTFTSGESFFHTILCNDAGLRLHSVDLHYERWGQYDPSPELLTADDLEDIRGSGAFFVRKVDTTTDGGLRDLLDRDLWEADP